MMTTRRRAATVALMSLAAAALILTGCGGGGDGGGGGTTGSVSGTINYAATGDGLGDIAVSIDGISTRTNDRGEFTLRGVPTGWRTLQINAPADRALVVPPGVPLSVDVRAGDNTLSAPIQLIDDVDSPPAPAY